MYYIIFQMQTSLRKPEICKYFSAQASAHFMLEIKRVMFTFTIGVIVYWGGLLNIKDVWTIPSLKSKAENAIKFLEDNGWEMESENELASCFRAPVEFSTPDQIKQIILTSYL